MPNLPFHLRIVRSLLRRLNSRSVSKGAGSAAEPFDAQKLKAAEKALRELPVPSEGARQYLEKHIPRLARTLALVPPPRETGRVLELGCYMQITPLLQRLCRYPEVRGAYAGPPGQVDQMHMKFPDGDFNCKVHHFDAERDGFPFPDEHFDLVVAGEIIEHMIFDPLHLLIESRRILREGGYLLLTTPNIAGLACVYKALEGKHNPQIHSNYKRPDAEPEIGHMREYTAWEAGEAVKAAGFEIERLFTTTIEDYAGDWRAPFLATLEELDFSTEDRGEQTWCLAVKRSALPVERFPSFLYSS